jgi:hypothetical protein
MADVAVDYVERQLATKCFCDHFVYCFFVGSYSMLVEVL